MHLKWRPGTNEVNIHHGTQPHSPIRIYTRVQTHLSLSCSVSFCQANTSLHSQTKWGNRSKLFAYKLMKHCKVKLSWMLITNVMHNLLINVSLHLVGRDGGTWGTALWLYAKQRKVFTLQFNMYCLNMKRVWFPFLCACTGIIKGIQSKIQICWKMHSVISPQAIQNVDEFVSSSEQIWRNLVLHHLLTNGSSAVNGCRQNEFKQLIKTSQ